MGGGGGFVIIRRRVFERVEKFRFSYVGVEGEGARDDDVVVVVATGSCGSGRRHHRRRIMSRPRLHRFRWSDAPFRGRRRNVTHPGVAKRIRTPGSLTQARVVHHVRMGTHEGFFTITPFLLFLVFY